MLENPPAWLMWATILANNAIMAWGAYEVKKVRQRYHDFIDNDLGLMNLQLQFAVSALKDAGLWKKSYDESMESIRRSR